jgi:hypothetical protein
MRLLLALAIALSACAPTREACASTPLVPNPFGATVRGVEIGPLFFAAGAWRDDLVARIAWAGPGDLVKVLVQPVHPMESPLVITGHHCADQKPLRFAESAPWAVGPAAPSPSLAVVERSGTPRMEIPALPSSMPNSYATQITYGGYFLFTAAGTWRVEVRDGDRLIGSFVVEVAPN